MLLAFHGKCIKTNSMSLFILSENGQTLKRKKKEKKKKIKS